MQRLRSIGLVLIAVTGVVAGCGDTDENPPGKQLDARIVELKNDPGLPLTPPTMSPAPIDAGLVAGWVAAESGQPGDDVRDPDAVRLPETIEGQTYLAVTSGTGCLPGDDAELWRDGTELHVKIVAPTEDDLNCDAENHAWAQLAVDSELVEGTRLINGRTPVAATGPAKLIEAIPVGALADDRTDLLSLRPIELTAPGDADPILDALDAAKGAENLDTAEAALTGAPPDGERRFVYLLEGCPDVDPALLVTSAAISAESAGDCTEPAQFILAVFDVPIENTTPQMAPTVYGQEP
ncbi:hypothetical protein FB566_2848 [Stackebrandtia endophytica]|uniref:Lipoprotein n=1 Tax=Stackebrandtia endophytica TaxID=1496996 RepID=A0A543AXI4_9ACTN|nr:hypothetical protein [Stackebrandtia endophytica]TQL77292.1 hypothetical protein FB566_2848 [Stackebrandtia endophytica]